MSGLGGKSRSGRAQWAGQGQGSSESGSREAPWCHGGGSGGQTWTGQSLSPLAWPLGEYSGA